MKISISGFTSAHMNTKMSNKKNIVQVPSLLINILRDAGHEADYNLENPDIYIVYIFSLGSINSSFAIQQLELIKANPTKVILSFDDWRIRQTYEGMEKIIKTKKFSKTHHTVDYKGVLDNLDVLQDIVNGKFITLIPAHKNGDHSLLGVRGEFVVYDPSIYVEKENIYGDQLCDLLPVHASLAADHKWLDKRNYSYIQVQGAREDYVFELYCRHRIVMSPPYYHNGSGWWRNRYSLANAARAVIIDDIGGVFGPAYEIERKMVTPETIEELFEKQDFMYNKNIMTKQENIDLINSVLEKF